MQIGTDARDVAALSRETLERIVDPSSEGILLIDAQDSALLVVFANGAYQELTGYTAAELAGRRWPLAVRAGNGEPELESLKAALAKPDACELMVPEIRKDGTPWKSRLQLEPLYDARGDLKYFLCAQRPLAAAPAERAQEAPAAPLARGRPRVTHPDRLDPVTGLLRFDYFKELLGRDLPVARRERRALTLLVFEIVELEAYRQTFGQKAADSCQRMIAAQVTRTLRRASDLCARCDDGTIVACVVDQHPVEAGPLAERIADHVRRLGLHNPRAKTARYVVVRSAVVSCDGDDADAAIARARAALHAAQEQHGTNRAAVI